MSEDWKEGLKAPAKDERHKTEVRRSGGRSPSPFPWPPKRKIKIEHLHRPPAPVSCPIIVPFSAALFLFDPLRGARRLCIGFPRLFLSRSAAMPESCV